MSRGLHIPTDPSQWGFKGKNYLFTIGIDKYAHWKPLNNAVKDVDDITEILTHRYQFDKTNIRNLRNDEATEDGIREALIDVKRVITKEDNLIVCFSGHGYYDEDIDEGYWVPVDAQLGKTSNYISNSDLLKWIRAIETHHTFILIDACFCGTLVSQSRSAVLSEKYPSSRVFASGRKELVDDGSPGKNSPFARAIISTLKRNVDQVLRATDLISSVTKQVELDAGQEPVEGRIKDARDDGGEFVFHLQVTEGEIWQSVVGADTSEDYAKYVDYFPDGVHAHDARDRMRQLTDEEDWQRARNIKSKASLTEYLESHPNGEHYDEVRKMLEELEEDGAWENAKVKTAVSGYLNYLRGYPDGKYVKEAKRQIDLLKREMQTDRQEQLEVELRDTHDAGKEAEEEKKQYKSVIKEAEAMFAAGRFADSIVKYEFALGLYQSSFVPESSFVQERMKRAKRGVEYEQYLREGKTAVTEGQYALALEYLLNAQKIEDTLKIRDWISHVSNKIEGGKKIKHDADFEGSSKLYTEQNDKQHISESKDDLSEADSTNPKKKKKKGCRIVLMVSLAAALLLTGSWVVWYLNSGSSTYGDYNDPIETSAREVQDQISDDDIGEVDRPPVTKNKSNTNDEVRVIKPNELSLDRVVLGSWYVYDRVIYDQSLRATGNLIEAYYDFYNNGTVAYTLGSYPYAQTAQGTWYLNGRQLTVSLVGVGNFTGNVSSFNVNEITWITSEPSFTTPVINYIRRNQ